MIPESYENNIYFKLYQEKLQEEIKYHYHAYRARLIFKLDDKVVKCTVSNIFIEPFFPCTFKLKGDNFSSLWDFLEANPGQYTFIGASRRKPDKIHKTRRLVFDFADYHTKPWKEGQSHTWEFTRELIIDYPNIKQLTESNLSTERIVPYITERMGW